MRERGWSPSTTFYYVIHWWYHFNWFSKKWCWEESPDTSSILISSRQVAGNSRPQHHFLLNGTYFILTGVGFSKKWC